MGAKQLNLTGKVFGKLTVVEQVESRDYGKTKKRMWKCECFCKKTVVVNTGSLTSGNTQSCGCLHSETSALSGKNSRHKVAKKDAGYRSIMNSYISNARKRGHEFNLTFDQFKEIVLSNCHYCNIEPSNTYLKNYYNVNYNGVDRKDNTKGYTLENCVPCCKMCNIAKNDNSYDDFLKWILKIYKKTAMDILTKNKELINVVNSTPNNYDLGEKIRRLVS